MTCETWPTGHLLRPFMQIGFCWYTHYATLRSDSLQLSRTTITRAAFGQPQPRPCRYQICAANTNAALLDRPTQHEHHKRLKVLPRVQYRCQTVCLFCVVAPYAKDRIRCRGSCSTNVKEIDSEELLKLCDDADLTFDQCIAPGKASVAGLSASTCM